MDSFSSDSSSSSHILDDFECDFDFMDSNDADLNMVDDNTSYGDIGFNDLIIATGYEKANGDDMMSDDDASYSYPERERKSSQRNTTPANHRPIYQSLVSPGDLEKQREEAMRRLSAYMERSANSRIGLTQQMSALCSPTEAKTIEETFVEPQMSSSSILGSQSTFKPQQLASTYKSILSKLTWV